MVECAWCGKQVERLGDTCDEWCYRRFISTHHGIVDENIVIPVQYWRQPWYAGADKERG